MLFVSLFRRQNSEPFNIIIRRADATLHLWIARSDEQEVPVRTVVWFIEHVRLGYLPTALIFFTAIHAVVDHDAFVIGRTAPTGITKAVRHKIAPGNHVAANDFPIYYLSRFSLRH